MIIDTSAVLAILFAEDDAERYARTLSKVDERLMYGRKLKHPTRLSQDLVLPGLTPFGGLANVEKRCRTRDVAPDGRRQFESPGLPNL